jgi:hypothetical protein
VYCKECQQNTPVAEFVICSKLMCRWQQVPLSTPALLHGISQGLQPTKILFRKDLRRLRLQTLNYWLYLITFTKIMFICNMTFAGDTWIYKSNNRTELFKGQLHNNRVYLLKRTKLLIIGPELDKVLIRHGRSALFSIFFYKKYILISRRYQLHPASATTACPRGITDTHSQKKERRNKKR